LILNTLLSSQTAQINNKNFFGRALFFRLDISRSMD